jgi:hypothetical protein
LRNGCKEESNEESHEEDREEEKISALSGPFMRAIDVFIIDCQASRLGRLIAFL